MFASQSEQQEGREVFPKGWSSGDPCNREESTCPGTFGWLLQDHFLSYNLLFPVGESDVLKSRNFRGDS